MIAIKDVKMPNCCSECGLKSGSYCYFKKPPYNFNGINILNERASDCPLTEIVTCKDCKYNVKNGENTTMCDIGHRFYMRDHSTFYCADAERKE